VSRGQLLGDESSLTIVRNREEGVVAKSNKAYTFRIVDFDVYAVQHYVPLESNWSFKFYSQSLIKSKFPVFNYRKANFSAIMPSYSPSGRIFID
jgi:hypothetical protein